MNTIKKDKDLILNKVEKREVDYLLSKYSVKQIETSLIKIFLEDNKLKTKNELLLEVLRKNDNDIKKKIKGYLESKNIKLNLKIIERFFELLIEPEDRKLNGVFYTPTFVVEYIVNETINENEKVCDLSCGSGAFLIGATERINKITNKSIIKIIEENIFGADISKTSVYRSKILLSLFALVNKEDKKEIKFNLIETDSLNYEWTKKYPNGFDAIIGNPPYVRVQNLPIKSRRFINENYFTASKGNIDLFIPFFELGLKLLKKTGRMGYISPNSFYTSRSSKKLREYIQENNFMRKILDFNHLSIFSGVTVYTCISLFDKVKKDKFDYAIIHEKKLLDKLDKTKFTKINYSSLNTNKWILLNKEDSENIRKIEDMGTPLGKIAKITNGIATLKDELYLLDGEKENGFFIKKYKDKKYLIEPEITRKIIKASVLKEEKDITNNKRKIIFPYELIGKFYQPIKESVLKQKYPMCYNYFLAIKNELSKRDRGNRQYSKWFAFGRVQGYNIFGKKIISPGISPYSRFVICNDDKTLYYGGIGIFPKININILLKVLQSKVFWYYIYKTSKEYKSEFWSLSKNFIENFGVPNFTKEEEKFMLNNTKERIDEFLIKKYNLNI
jgi:adenine-specific DNA-methyltransferase